MDVVIKPANSTDLEFLNKNLPTSIPHFHENNIADHDNGTADWLIAYKDNLPVGHFLIRYDGCHNENVKQYISNCAHLESGGVKEEYRKQGIGTALIKKAEELAIEKGFKQIGMAVGADDNPSARRLYENLNYKEWDKGTFDESWKIINKEGVEVTETEVCTYLIKSLN
jgi:GNAT superfamily N-acetyltransferase